MNDLAIALSIFFIGLLSFITADQKLIKYILAAEIIFIAAIYLFITADTIYQQVIGTIFSIFIISISILDVIIYIFIKTEREK